MITGRLVRFVAYTALAVSCFLPSRSNEMTSQHGEHVKAWEPAISIHLQILFSPVIEWFDYQSFIPISDLPDQIWSDMWSHIFYWLSITATGWLFLLYPALRRWPAVRWPAFGISVLGLAFLIHHLYDWATIYEPYFHLGTGGYFLVSAYLAFATYICMDAAERTDVETIANA
jgi:hypothetical protein